MLDRQRAQRGNGLIIRQAARVDLGPKGCTPGRQSQDQEQQRELESRAACSDLRRHLPVLLQPRDQNRDHAQNQKHVAGEDQRLPGVLGDRQDGHFTAFLLAVAALEEAIATVGELVVHLDVGGVHLPRWRVSHADPAAELCRTHGARVVVDLESIQVHCERQGVLHELTRLAGIDKHVAGLSFP